MKPSYQAMVRKCEPEKIGSDVFLLELKLREAAGFMAGPGQFVVLEPKSSRSVMPRPFSVADIKADIISVLVKAVGRNTKAYSKLKKGDKIMVTGPLGSVIPVKSHSESYILVGGGIGGAALTLLAKEIAQRQKMLIVLLGARKESQLSGLEFFNKLGDKAFVKTTVESRNGSKGFVTDLLDWSLEVYGKNLSTVIACGPKPMLKKVAEICKRTGNRCLVMLEEVMACGMGSCKGCAVFGKDGSVKHICSDGPAFDAEWIDWEKFVPDPIIRKPKKKSVKRINLGVRLGRIKMEYPTMNASGCLSVDAIEQGKLDISKLGAYVTKGVTVLERNGNPMPRSCETPSGMINSIGLENIGIERFVTEELPRWLALGKPVFVNISGFSLKDFSDLASILDLTAIAGFEVNISCPNVNQGKIVFGIDPEEAYKATMAVSLRTNKLVVVKLTPNVTDIVKIAQAVVTAGADAISLINTIQAMAIDPYTLMPKIGMVTGGLSGPAIRPVAVRMVHQLFKAQLGVPIIGMGGIEDGESAAEFFIAGANAVAVGTGGFSDRGIFSHINGKLLELLRFHGFSDIGELVGSLKTD